MPPDRPPAVDDDRWDHRRVFALLRELGRLRVIHRSGASTFEALCTMGPHGFAGGYLNAITDAYHWHVKLDEFGFLRTHDTTHARSGRRVLFFELCATREAKPFAMIYLHREKGAEFEVDREKRFLEAHAALATGRELEPFDGEAPE
ncbi:MAG: hypothetical protein AAF430_08855 [Myxococcota bacterium]